MAKRQKTKVFSFQGFDNAHYKTTEAYTRAVNALLDKATNDIADAASKENYNPDKPFSFEDYPKTKARLQTTLKGLAKKMQAVIELGSRKQWLFACQKNDDFIASIFDTTKLTKGRLEKMQDRNLDALQSFQQRKVGGMNLSERVWKYTRQYKDQIEIGLDVGLGEGRSAQQLSRDLRQNLQDPNRLFRRVRDKRGNLQLSKVAKAFHPGIGVYRSSYKNAMRLTRSEINMAYREADHLRWQQLDFVIGFEIRRANKDEKDLYKCKLCDRLVGKYPKEFKFKGWHPQCMCYCIPILEDFYSKERSDDRVARLKAALNGTEHKKYVSKHQITDYPDGFKEWVKENAPKQSNWATTPYFIKDNFVDGDLSKGLKYIQLVKPKTEEFDYNKKNIALEDYISGEGMWVNRYLRGLVDMGKLHDDEQALIDELTKATTMEKVGERTLWRSVDASAIFGKISSVDLDSLKAVLMYDSKQKFHLERSRQLLDIVGKDILEKGFMSTTKDENIALEFGGYTGARLPILMKIRTNKNTRGVDVEKYTKIHNPQAEEEQPQKEILLARNQRYKVVGISSYKDELCIEVELIDETNENILPIVDPIQKELDALQPMIAEARKKGSEWGVNTSAIDSALLARNPNAVKAAITAINTEVEALKSSYNAFVLDANKTIEEANKVSVDFTDVLKDSNSLMGNKAQWKLGQSIFKKRLQDLKNRIVRSLKFGNSSTIHPAVKTTYRTNTDVDETFKAINQEFTTERWFENGDLRLAMTSKRGVNGSTAMDGRISLTYSRLELVKSALSKIGRGMSNNISFEEADAMATFWHEITHNRNKYGNMRLTNIQIDVMEMMNEFVARKTLPEFYAKLGVKSMPHPEFVTNRASTGYNPRVVGYDYVIQALNLDKDKVLLSAKKHLFTLRYDEQNKTAVQALLDGGLDKFKRLDGKPLGKAQVSKIVAMCRKGESTEKIKNYLIEEQIIDRE